MSLFSDLRYYFSKPGRYNAWPAHLIDQEYRDEPSGIFSKIWSFIKVRAIYAFLFIPLSIVDAFVSRMYALYWASGTALLSDDKQKDCLRNQAKYATYYSKNLYSLLASALGLISPKLVAFYFTPEHDENDGVRSGGQYYHDKNAKRVMPTTKDEIKQLIINAPKNNQKVMAVGAGLSQGKQFLPEGDNKLVIDLRNFKTIELNIKNKTARVGAGALWSDIQKVIDEAELALLDTQASPVFSAAGSISTNIHGWNHKIGTLSNAVESIEIINAKGEEQTLTPNDELFHYVTGGLGLFGVITHVTLKLTDNVLLSEKGVEIQPEKYVKHFREVVQKSDDTHMHLYRLSLDPNNLLGSGVAVSYDHDVNTDKKPVKSKNLVAEESRGTRWNRVMVNLARRIPWLRKYYWESERTRLIENKSPKLTTNEIMQPPVRAMFNPSVSEAEWLQEYFLPEEKLAEFLKQLGKILMDNKVPLLNASVRFVKQNKHSPMCYAKDGDRFAVVLCFNQSLKEEELIKAKKWLREAQHLAVEKGGTFYLPYQHVTNPEDFNKAYPKAKKAQKKKEEIDEKNLFTSGFHQKYMMPQPSKPNYFKEIMANEQTKKEFAGFLEVVLKRVDTDKFFALLEDILKYNDSHEEIYEELCKRLPEVMPGKLGSLKRILDSLSSIKTDLGNQAHLLLPRDLKEINGLVEIGYPGRFVNGFKEHYKVKGPVVAVYEEPSLTDYIQTGFPRPYDQFAKLDYNKPNLKGLKDKSADVITCYVGLHHFPENELDAFLKDVKRVLRDGGHFLLVDHDVTDKKSLAMAHMAHMVFNAVTGVSVKDEMSERRNFHSIQYWQKKLAEHGLGYEVVEGPDVKMIREGDPSRNRMVSFVNKGPKINSSLSLLSKDSKKKDKDENNLQPNINQDLIFGNLFDKPDDEKPVIQPEAVIKVN